MINKKLTAIALLTVTTLAGSSLTIGKTLAASNNGCNGVVKNVELTDRQNKTVFCSNDNSVKDLSQFGTQAFSAGIQGGTFQFYNGKNFTGKSVIIQDGFGQGNLKSLGKVSSFKRVR